MFATSYIPSIRTGSVGVSLLQVHKAGGLPGPIVGHYWLKSPLAQHRLPALRPSCTSRDKADHSGTYEEPLGLNLRSEQVPREPYLEVGSIITTHGVRGEVKVQALTDFPRERLLTPGIRWLQAGNSGPVKECYLEGGRSMVSKGREIWIVKLRDCDSLNESELLRGQTLLVSSTDRPELEDEDDFLVQDLIECDVVLQKDDLLIGRVLDVFDGTGPGAHDFLKISLTDKASAGGAASKQPHTMLLPFVKEFVPMIDEEKQTIYITPPSGLLELAMAPPSRGKIKKVPT
ncbi:hypothetical protein ABBQ32_012117 [Trebouxia sp. C0010 RCD-2024]